MSRPNRAVQKAFKVPWNAFGYDKLPDRFSRSQPGSKSKKKRRLPQKEWMIVRGDLVEILSGKDKGKQGKVKEVIRSKNTLVVTGLNTVRQRLEATDDMPGTYVQMEEPLPYTDVALVDPGDKQATTVSLRFTERGEKVRVSDRTGRIIAKPPWERRDWKERSVLKDGPQDTSPSVASRSTYMPSLLHFHEEIMLIHGIKPSVVKTRPSLRDRIITDLEENTLVASEASDITVATKEQSVTRRWITYMMNKFPFFR